MSENGNPGMIAGTVTPQQERTKRRALQSALGLREQQKLKKLDAGNDAIRGLGRAERRAQSSYTRRERRRRGKGETSMGGVRQHINFTDPSSNDNGHADGAEDVDSKDGRKGTLMASARGGINGTQSDAVGTDKSKQKGQKDKNETSSEKEQRNPNHRIPSQPQPQRQSQEHRQRQSSLTTHSLTQAQIQVQAGLSDKWNPDGLVPPSFKPAAFTTRDRVDGKYRQ